MQNYLQSKYPPNENPIHYVCNYRIKLLSDSPQSSVIHIVCHLEVTLIPYLEIRYVFERVCGGMESCGQIRNGFHTFKVIRLEFDCSETL